jgi:hypothetical protein
VGSRRTRDAVRPHQADALAAVNRDIMIRTASLDRVSVLHRKARVPDIRRRQRGVNNF